jgi:integral membrane protein (TIGR00529 family)
LIKKKWKLEYVILWASLLAGVFFNLSPIQIGNNFVLALIDPATLKLIGIIVLVYILSGVLRKVESLRDLVDSLQGLVKDYRLTLAFIPALLVRHIWEFVWPLFPGIILFAGLLKVEIQEVILVQFPLTIATVIVGFVWEYKNLKKDTTLINRKDILFNLKKLFFGIWPILLIIILVLGTKTDLLFSLVIVILSLIFSNIKKISLKMLKDIIRNDIDLSVVILIAGIMIFKRILQVSGGIEIIPEAFAKLGVHPFIVLFSIPFFIGMMTGMGTAALGIGLPVLLPIIVQGEANLYYAMLAFTGSFVGVMISPMHLCLVVTRNYFKVDMGKIYKMLILPLTIIILSALILVMVRA